MYTLHVTNRNPQNLNYPIHRIPNLIDEEVSDNEQYNNNPDITLSITNITDGINEISLEDDIHYITLVIVNGTQLTQSKYNTTGLYQFSLITNKLNEIIKIPIIIDEDEHFSYKRTIKKYLLDTYQLSRDDISIKHLNTLDNYHNYLIKITDFRKVQLLNLQNISNSLQLGWKHYYIVTDELDKFLLSNAYTLKYLSTIKLIITCNYTIHLIDCLQSFVLI